jgi:hypothetical protein
MMQYTDFFRDLREMLPWPRFTSLIEKWGGLNIAIPSDVTQQEDAREIYRELASWGTLEDLVENFNIVLQRLGDDYGYTVSEIREIHKKVHREKMNKK